MIPIPYQLGIALLIFLAGFTGGVKVQTWHLNSLDKANVESNLESERIAGRARTAAESRVVAAQSAAVARANHAAADAADARTELGRVRSVSDAAVAAARVSHEACLDKVDAFSDIFLNCTRRYQAVAESADGHANDAKTLSDAWPISPPKE